VSKEANAAKECEDKERDTTSHSLLLLPRLFSSALLVLLVLPLMLWEEDLSMTKKLQPASESPLQTKLLFEQQTLLETCCRSLL
jgi:hypothetical protein